MIHLPNCCPPRLLRLAALALLGAIPALAQSPPIAGIAHVAIAVQDLAQSLAFYNKLGFEEAFHFGEADHITQTFLKINDNQFLELYPATPKQPVGFLHLCFFGEDLNALHDFDVAQGLSPISVRKAHAGNLLFTLQGPEHQNIEYTQYLPGSLHSDDRGKHLGPERIATSLFAVGLAMHDRAAARDFYLHKLTFNPIAGHPWLLGVPGPSHQQLLLVPDTLLPHGLAFFHVDDLAKVASELKRIGIPATTSAHALSVTDPDGNLLIFETTADATPLQASGQKK